MVKTLFAVLLFCTGVLRAYRLCSYIVVAMCIASCRALEVCFTSCNNYHTVHVLRRKRYALESALFLNLYGRLNRLQSSTNVECWMLSAGPAHNRQFTTHIVLYVRYNQPRFIELYFSSSPLTNR